MTADTQAQGDLPELPDPSEKTDSWRDEYGYERWEYAFSADQMREYGRLCLAAALQGRAQEGEPSEVLAALKGMQRFWGKYPAFVPAPEYREQAYAAVDAMNAALAQASRVEIGEAKNG